MLLVILLLTVSTIRGEDEYIVQDIIQRMTVLESANPQSPPPEAPQADEDDRVIRVIVNNHPT